jgi:uncharacterized protein (DUF433 family)
MSNMQFEAYLDFLEPDDIRLKGHRLGIEHILRLYLDGYAPEEIAQFYPPLQLVEIYAALTYYHAHREAMQAYLARLEAWSQQRLREEEAHDMPPVVRRLKALKAHRQNQRGHDEVAFSVR